MKKIYFYLFVAAAAAGLASCAGGKTLTADYGVIPLPREIKMQGEIPYLMKRSATIGYSAGDDSLAHNARLLAGYLKEITGKEHTVAEGEGDITLRIDPSVTQPEGYRLTVAADQGVVIAGSTLAGIFYGIQTLRKSLPAEVKGKVEMPAVTINDYPSFAYRGMHLDAARHYFTPDSIKIYLDILALHNVNRFHWHIIDDQGWRIEIKKYPRLTEIGSVRKETVIGRNSGEYDGKEYGGFYTQDEVRDIIAYAAERHITIIPEIDLPGHQQATLAAYPELGCTGGPYEVWGQWGVSDNVICAGNEQAMQLLEDVLAEVIDLFPSEYIHIGGDECPKTRWEKCPKCQARIAGLGIRGDKRHSAEEYLQSYVITRMEKFVESKGRHIIGWDEILEGGLAPNATVMSWRGVRGGIEAAKQEHDVIMTPNSYLYFDYYQTRDVANEPLGIGGYVPVEQVYSFDPAAGIPEEFKKYVIGVQANLWTEYITNFRHVEYMLLPRLAALAEVQWSDPATRDYDYFLQRLVRMMELYDRLGYNYARHIFDLTASVRPDVDSGYLEVTLNHQVEGDIYYTLDGTEPTTASPKYASPLRITGDADLRAIMIRPNGYRSRILSETFRFNKATVKPITLKENPSRGYAYTGATVLNDGLSGDENYRTGRWLGFQGADVDAVIDLKTAAEISRVAFNTNVAKGDWVFGATEAVVKVSDDGASFRQVASLDIPVQQEGDRNGVFTHELTFPAVKARYVEVIIRGSGPMPAWHGAAGRPSYVFVDEITVE